ncbi:carboxypeptidase-like regulatory domain-containing protein [Hymenobacter koreensis]|uniref:Carboxypeptidase-like regulatory domain-containing protein n=1 Tax=Hymenobacter koreensis TaxID=1084523 RepID=A0ABP8J2P0_9BACT
MKHFCSLLALALFFGSNSAMAQTETAQLTGSLETDTETMSVAGSAKRLACSQLEGRVLNAEGKPLIGATLLVKGTQYITITDQDGRFKLEAPVQEKQILTVEAAGYTPLLLPLASCSLPDLTLERDASTRIKRSGKRAGQVTRVGDAFLQ